MESRIVGMLFSGFMCKVYATGFAIWIAVEAGSFLINTASAIGAGFGG